MKHLLPHHFRRIGLFLTPIGLLGWLALQYGILNLFLESILSKSELAIIIRDINLIFASVCIISFLLGIIFISFSKERKENTDTGKIRLESLQIAALVQIIFIFLMFIGIISLGSPSESSLLILLMISLFLFWGVYNAKYLYTIHKITNN